MIAATLTDPEARSLVLSGALSFWLRFLAFTGLAGLAVVVLLRLLGISPVAGAVRAFDRFLDTLDED